jgi:hypothetical protein
LGLVISHCLITKDTQGGEITSKFDHISPNNWCSDATVVRVNLNSCWLLGQQQVTTSIPDAESVFEKLLAEAAPNIDMLTPLGTLLVNQCDQESNSNDNKDNNDPDDLSPEECGPFPLVLCKTLYQMAFYSTQLLTNQLMCVMQWIDTEPDPWSASITSCNNTSKSLGPMLCIGNPVAVLVVWCNTLMVLAVAQVNQLCFVSHTNLDNLAVHYLPTPQLNCQTTIEGDPMHTYA